MRIEHIAIWVSDLETTREFYEKYFNVKSNVKYVNPVKGFSSYFLSFEDGARIEIMHKEGLDVKKDDCLGLAHFAISLGSKERVDELTKQLRVDGFTVEGEPRTTGDGYYESVIKDPAGNLIELTK